MKHIFIIFAFIPILTYGQTFNLLDTVLQKGDVYRTYEIKYDLSEPSFCAESNLFLDSIVKFMLVHQNLIFELSVYGDATQLVDDNSNWPTYSRAECLKDFLVEKGINPDRVETKAYHESPPIIADSIVLDNMSGNELFLKNQWTEFKIMEIEENVEPLFDYSIVEKKPIFPGGDVELFRYISNNLSFSLTQNECVFTRVFLSFTIESTGKCIDPDVFTNVCTISEMLKMELSKMILEMPIWKPGEFDGKPVNVRITIPVHVDFK